MYKLLIYKRNTNKIFWKEFTDYEKSINFAYRVKHSTYLEIVDCVGYGRSDEYFLLWY